MSVFDNIKRFSRQRGYSLQTTAEKSGLSKNAIYQYNNGKNPSYETLKKIADTLSVSPTDLIDGGEYVLKIGEKELPIKKPNLTELSQDINNAPGDEQGVELIAAHWGRDLSRLTEDDRKKIINQAESYILGLIDAYENKD